MKTPLTLSIVLDILQLCVLSCIIYAPFPPFIKGNKFRDFLFTSFSLKKKKFAPGEGSKFFSFYVGADPKKGGTNGNARVSSLEIYPSTLNVMFIESLW